MPPEYELPHLDISATKDFHNYKAHARNMGGGSAPRIREEHGAMLKGQLQAAFQEVEAQESPDDRFERAEGAYYEVQLRKGANAQKLDRKTDEIISGATKLDRHTDDLSTVLFVPDDAMPALEAILEEYRTGPLTERGQSPPNKAYVEPIETIRRARLSSFWTDHPDTLPTAQQGAVWWEIWCHRGAEQQISAIVQRIGCRVSDAELWLRFPEVVVMPVFARRAEIEVALFATPGISELRRGSDSPTFFTEDERDNQHAWVDDVAERTRWPNTNVPRVCLLDTGVNRAHTLLEPAISERDLMSAHPDWVTTDNRPDSHGTEMAGVALHGDLFTRMQDQNAVVLKHRLESVRIMPADGFPPNEPARLGSITQTAVSLAEIQNPERDRVFCMAVTNGDATGERPTAWSACIDRTAAGLMEGDDEDRPRRLFVVASGNRPPHMNAADFLPIEEYPVEDPSQAWNALTIGGCTDKVLITEPSLAGYGPVARAGEISPYSRNSLKWPQGKTPMKPELVMEAGNRACSANGQDFVSCTSLELLTTGSDADRLPIVNFSATSAATALAARMAARLKADHPDYWPETIRALMVHSAQWTPPMLERFATQNGMRERQRLIREYGYGVPSYERARASAVNDLALVVQQEIQPYEKKATGIGFHECHYYALPWPRELLQSRAFATQQFCLKATLSYFIEPNPGRAAAVDPQKYQSFGLRFDLKRSRENPRQFKFRINAEEAAPAHRNELPDSGWMLGPTSIAAGSLHCDIWKGPGAELASRDMICVKPVSGWWKERRNPEICQRSARYALIVTLSAPALDIDLYTPVSQAIEQAVGIPIENLF